jgi:hypothetical protein
VTDCTAVNFWYYPLKEVVSLKWNATALWPVTERELERAAREMVATLESKWMLVREDVLKALYVGLARGGSEPLLLYDQHRAKVVEVVQRVLRQL